MKAASEIDRLQTLLAESAWVRRLAARLVSDPGEVDDVVQDTWTAALRRPPTGDDSPRPWLATVLRNAARSRARSGGARMARESRRAADSETSYAAPEELLGRLELQEMLSRCVRELPAELADVVTLRYYEGLSSAEIARRRDVPAGTVRWRLKRGLEILRERLDRRYDGERSSWMAVLLPLARTARPERGALGSGLAASLLAPVIAMPLFWKLTCALAVALACLLPFRGADRGADPPALAAASSQPPLAAPSNPVDEALAGAIRPDEREPVPLGGGADVAPPRVRAGGGAAADRVWTRARVRVVDPFGNPIAGASVRAEPTATTLQELQRRLAHLGPLEQLAALGDFRKTTEADGVVRFETDLLVTEGQVELVVVGPNYESSRTEIVVAPGDDLDLGDVTLAPAGAVAGEVRGRDGAPFAAAHVVLGSATLPEDTTRITERGPSPPSSHSETTDRRGQFERIGVPPGDYRVFVRAGSRWAWSEPVRVEAGALASGVAIVLDVTSVQRAELTVLGHDGTPWPHATYRIRRGGSMSSQAVGPEGRTDLTRLWDSFSGGRLEITDDRVLHYAVTIDPLPHVAEPIVVRLERAATIERSIQVVDRSGAPLEDVDVIVHAFDSDGWAETDVRGETPVTLPAAEPFDIRVDEEGYAPLSLQGLRVVDLADAWRVVLDRLPGIAGSVTVDGAPLARVDVSLYEAVADGEVVVRGASAGSFQPRSLCRARTDHNGRFQLHHGADGRLVLLVERRGFADAATAIEDYRADRGASFDIALVPGGAVEGTLRQSDGTPVPARHVFLDHPLYEARFTRTDMEGDFAFPRVPAGDWLVHVLEELPSDEVTRHFGPGYWEFDPNCAVVDGKTTRHDLSLPDPVQHCVDLGVTLRGAEVAEPCVRVQAMDPWRGMLPGDCLPPSGDRFVTSVARAPAYRLSVGVGAFGGVFGRDVRPAELPLRLDATFELARLAGAVAGLPPSGGQLRIAGSADGWAYEQFVPLGAAGSFGPFCVPAGAVDLRVTVRAEEGYDVREHCSSAVQLEVGEESSIAF